MKIIKRISLISTLAILVFLGCSDAPSSLAKEDPDPIPQETVTIGVEGGIVEKDDISVTIHRGAFTANPIPQFASDSRFSLSSNTGDYGCNSIVDMSYYYHGFTTISTVTRQICNEDSYIQVVFEKE
jgi:hypothetical protein